MINVILQIENKIKEELSLRDEEKTLFIASVLLCLHYKEILILENIQKTLSLIYEDNYLSYFSFMNNKKDKIEDFLKNNYMTLLHLYLNKNGSVDIINSFYGSIGASSNKTDVKEGDIVLNHTCGTSSVLKVARSYGASFIGVELQERIFILSKANSILFDKEVINSDFMESEVKSTISDVKTGIIDNLSEKIDKIRELRF